MTKTKISYIFPVAHRFRMPFHNIIREKLSARGVEYIVVYSDAFGDNILRRDTIDIPWGRKVTLLRPFGDRGPLIQNAFMDVIKSDYVIVQQESRLFLNYFCLLLSALRLKKVAFFGHGRNLQARNAKSFSERVKLFLATKADWWFAYTRSVADYVHSLGFPRGKITIFNNAIDVTALKHDLDGVTETDLVELKQRLGIASSARIGIYIGGLYEEKRISFLVESAEKIHRRVPDFVLLIVGDGPDRGLVEQAARSHDWVKFVGARFGRDKAVALSAAYIFLMPGLVGLAILDAFAAGLPIVTTSYPFHSPEIDYLDHGMNGIIVETFESSSAYADAASALLNDSARLACMSEAAKSTAAEITIEAMADRFFNGLCSWIEASNGTTKEPVTCGHT